MTKAPDRVGEIMMRAVVTVSRADSVEAVVRAMVEHDIGSVVVVDGDAPVGLFTERDLTRQVLDQRDVLQRPVGEVMSSPVIWTHPGAEIVEAFDLMNERTVRRLAVVEDGRLVGIVTERDLLRWVSAVAQE